jgi:hypothetical protein
MSSFTCDARQDGLVALMCGGTDTHIGRSARRVRFLPLQLSVGSHAWRHDPVQTRPVRAVKLVAMVLAAVAAGWFVHVATYFGTQSPGDGPPRELSDRDGPGSRTAAYA